MKLIDSKISQCKDWNDFFKLTSSLKKTQLSKAIILRDLLNYFCKHLRFTELNLKTYGGIKKMNYQNL